MKKGNSKRSFKAKYIIAIRRFLVMVEILALFLELSITPVTRTEVFSPVYAQAKASSSEEGESDESEDNSEEKKEEESEGSGEDGGSADGSGENGGSEGEGDGGDSSGNEGGDDKSGEGDEGGQEDQQDGGGSGEEEKGEEESSGGSEDGGESGQEESGGGETHEEEQPEEEKHEEEQPEEEKHEEEQPEEEKHEEEQPEEEKHEEEQPEEEKHEEESPEEEKPEEEQPEEEKPEEEQPEEEKPEEEQPEEEKSEEKSEEEKTGEKTEEEKTEEEKTEEEKTEEEKAKEGKTEEEKTEEEKAKEGKTEEEKTEEEKAKEGKAEEEKTEEEKNDKDKEKEDKEKEEKEKEKIQKDNKLRKDLLEVDEEEEEEEIELLEGELESEDGLLKISFDEDAEIPEGSEVVAGLISSDDDDYDSYVNTALEEGGLSADDIAGLKVLDISVLNDGDEIEPQSSVVVDIDADALFGEGVIYADDEVIAVHISGDEAEFCETDVVSDDEEDDDSCTRKADSVRFIADSLSVFVIAQLVGDNSVSTSDEDGCEITADYDNTSGIPAGTRLMLNDTDQGTDDAERFEEECADLFEEEFALESVRAYEVGFEGRDDGEQYQPDKEIYLTIDPSDDIFIEGATVVLIRPDGQAEAVDFSDEETTVSFGTDSLSVFYIAQFSVKRTLTAGDGSSYQVTVNYDSVSGIPEDAVLSVSEITDEDAGYDEYVEKSSEEVEDTPGTVQVARAFDISLINPDTGEEYQPTKPIQVSIQFPEDNLDDCESLDVVHIHGENEEETELVDSTISDDSIEFESEGFSVYVVVKTVKIKTLTASDGRDYHVTVTYDITSGIPENAELSVHELKQGEMEYEAYISAAAEALGKPVESLEMARPFDITLKDPDTGEEYQPDKDVQVSIDLLEDNLNDYDEISVVHFSGTADGETEIMDVTVGDDAIEFGTDGFSIFVITGESSVPRCTYTFYVWSTDVGDYSEYTFTDDQGRSVTKQAIKNGNELVVPQMVSETEVFVGWYEGTRDSTGGVTLADSPYDFDNITIPDEDSAVDLYAVYNPCVNVIFHDQYDSDSDSFPVAFTRRGELKTTGEGDGAVTSALVKITDISATYTSTDGSNMTFLGWSETPISTPGSETDDKGDPVTKVTSDGDGCITISDTESEKHLYPIFKEFHWLTYYAAESGTGAEYVAPAKYFKNDFLMSPLPTTSREGYDFLGWWTGTLTSDEHVNYGAQITDGNGNLVSSADDGGVYISNDKLYLRSDATLFAKWEARTTAEYLIVINTQSPDDADNLADAEKTYVFRESIRLSARIGDEVSVRDEDKNRNYDGYTFGHCDESKTVAADGSTVLNVYYDKNSSYTPGGSYKLVFEDSATKGKSTDLPVEYNNIPYGESITSKIPANPKRRGYEFTKWYLDPYCKEEAHLDKMPDHNLTVYAGWEQGWYIVTIDPNYGALYTEEGASGTGSTWFWTSYEDEFVGEYRHTTRDYVESSSGTWYYVNHAGDGKGGDNGWGDRKTYYTQDPGQATEDTTFEYAPGIYTYAGWYEVNPDGTETPYTFGKHADHNMTLRLHWKKAGTYYLSYDAGSGTLDDGSKNYLVPQAYSDYAEIVLTKSAKVNGFAFVGWQVRGSDSTMIYKPGQTFTLNADDAVRVAGKDVVYLDAVYVKVGTAGIVYNANGGSVANVGNFDFGYTFDSGNNPIAATGTVNTEDNTAAVSGLVNNSKFKLSSGRNFTKEGFTLAGWSNKAVYDPNDDDAELYDLDGEYGVDKEEPVTLYAVWSADVTYYLNETQADWGGNGEGGSWGDPYEYHSGDNTHTLKAYLNAEISEPGFIPEYTGTDERLFHYWATRSGAGTTQDPYVYTQYDYSQPITGALDLYAYWSGPVIVPVHAVDASAGELVERSSDDGWSVQDIKAGKAETALDASSHVTVPAGAGYTFAFAAASADLDSVSLDNAVTAVKYDAAKKSVCVKYGEGPDFTELESGKHIWFVYYLERELSIGYKYMDTTGALTDVATAGPAATDIPVGNYSMGTQLTDPLSLANSYSYYAFAIGDQNSENASQLIFLTDAAGAGNPVPTLKVRNTWRGFEYTTGNGESAEWVNCGYDPHLYVIYYTQQPTTIIFREKTLGTSAVMTTPFTFDVKVTQTVTDGSNVETTTLFDTTASGSSPYILKNGEERSAILFYSAAEGEPTTTQTITITQHENIDFTTAVSAEKGTAAQRAWTYTSSGDPATCYAVFTNTHKVLPVTVHVAMAENDGTTGGIILRDNLRSDAQAKYKFDLALGDSKQFLTVLPAASVFAGDAAHSLDDYAFGAVLYGSGAENDGDAISVEEMGVVSVAYENRNGNIYELVLKDSDGNILGELGGNDIYYLYYRMPKIQYVKENADGSLTAITGCISEGGSIVPDNSVTYGHSALSMNGKTVEQNQSLEIPLDGLMISQSGNNFRMPPILDDGVYERYLKYDKLGAGAEGISSISELGENVSADLTMQLKVQNNTLQFSFDGDTWNDLPIASSPTVYAIYTERGYDFQLSKTVDTTQSGENPIFTDSSYSVTISSLAITKDIYEVEGAEESIVAATPAHAGTPGTIVLEVKDGTKVRIKALGQGDYTITESGNDNYTLTAKKGPIVGGTTSVAEVTDNTTIALTLDSETKLDLTNTPKAICKIGNHYFYTLRSMVDYVVNEIPNKTATAEMLIDYVMPLEDTVEIPGGVTLTLETAEEGFSGSDSLAVIKRTDELAGVPLFTAIGNVSFENIVLDGNSVEATAPMIQSSGNLTIGSGATIRNAINISTGDGAVYGGAVNANGGNITVSGGRIEQCSSEDGGAIYYTGNGVISVSEQGLISNNTAAAGNGGAIYMNGGTLSLSESSNVTGNKAESGMGGAVYATSAMVTVKDNAGLTNNTAAEGGAVYVGAGTITISESEGYNPPYIIGNTAKTGDGGAFYIGTGSMSVSGGKFTNNKAESGNGGAIYADGATITISGTAELNNNTAGSGGAVYANTETVTISGGSLENNTASSGNGGAVSAQNGKAVLSGSVSFKNNKASAGNGGAVYAAEIDAAIGQAAQITGNEAGNGGAVYAGRGSITLSESAAGAPAVTGNKSVTGDGGGIWLGSGSVTVSGGSLSQNEAKGSGGAIYTQSAGITLTSSDGHSAVIQGNIASDGNGGAMCSESGAISIQAGTIGGTASGQGNRAGQNGGVLYAGSGAVNIGAVTMSGNESTGNGGAVYVGSGTAELAGTTLTANTAANGAAIFINTGKAGFSGGTYTENVATSGGAVGMGSTDARLTFSGNVQIKDNTIGSGDEAPKSNVYLDQDSDTVLNFAGLGTDAAIGIYVPDALTATRDVPGARFGSYTNDSNVNRIANDRYGFNVQKDVPATKLFWGVIIQVEVRYLASFGSGFPPATAGTTQYTNNEYYPEFSTAAISEMASQMYNKYAFNPGSATAVYAAAFVDDATDYSEYVTMLTWDSSEAKWKLTGHDGSTIELESGRKLIIYYSEPAYINIENNTVMTLNISEMKVNDRSVINSSTEAGYGMVFAQNGAIRTSLLPVEAADMQLAANRAVTLLIPGGRGMQYAVKGSFIEPGENTEVHLRRGDLTSLDDKWLNLDSTGSFVSLTDKSVSPATTQELVPANTLTGTMLTSAGTYQMIFGEDKYICKVVDADGREHPYSEISAALSDIENGVISLAEPSKAVIEMITDYLLPASDKVEIPRGFDITLTTATEGKYKYDPVDANEPRATISRDSENMSSMVDGWKDSVKAKDGTILRINDLVFDGKSVRGNSDGGAVISKFVDVYIDNVDFRNVYASNGGAMLIMFSEKDKNNKATVSGTVLDVKNSNFEGCTSWTTETSNRLGGGAIVTNAETMTLDNCSFDTCTAVDQAGAVFHRVDGNYTSYTNINDCVFTNCRANAAGGLELDSKTITVTNTSFTNCVAMQRNGGGFNVFALNSSAPTADCSVTLENCDFTNCQANTYGGGFRSTSVYTKVMNCSFTNTYVIGNYTGSNNGAGDGGAIGISNTNAKGAEIYACTITGCKADGKEGNGGGIYYAGKDLTIGDTYTSIIDNEEHTGTMSITNTTAKNMGGGVYYGKDSGYVNITNTVINGNSCTNTSGTGGGVYALGNNVAVTGSTVTNNTSASSGGGIYTNARVSLSISGTTISGNSTASKDGGGVCHNSGTDTSVLTVNSCTLENNTAVNGNGGGIWTKAEKVTISKGDGYENGTEIRTSTAKSGGGIYQENKTGNSFLLLEDATVSGCRATNGGGGGIRTNARTVTLTGTTVSSNSASSDGGGLWYDESDTNRDSMSLTVNGSAIDGNSSGGNGGGIYTQVKTVTLRSVYTVGTESVSRAVSVSNNTASKNGGGIYQKRNAEGSVLTAEGSEDYRVVISGNRANGSGSDGLGGGIYADVRSGDFIWAEVSGNRAGGSGGGINVPANSAEYYLTLDNTEVSGNTSGNQGGGIYTRTQLHLKNNSMITGNRLTGNTVTNSAGVYLQDSRTLYVGTSGAAEADSSSVKDNFTASGSASNLRLWTANNQNHSSSVYVYCDLSGVIGVVNAAKVGTQFGTSQNADPIGFSDDSYVFRADTSTLHGIIDRTDETGKKIIWAGPPIAKITDGGGKLLYLNGGNRAAIFDRLYNGAEGAENIIGAFNVLNYDTPPLYYSDGTLYSGEEYCVKMLVENYASDDLIYNRAVAGRKVTFTSAPVTDQLYPGEAERATVTAGNIPIKTLLTTRGNLVLENIVIDGANKVRTLWYESKVDSTCTLGGSAILQNGNTNNYGGGGVYITKYGDNNAEFIINGGVIRNCQITNNQNGGAIYLKSGTLKFEAGNITACTAAGNGGGVFQNSGIFNMSGGTISGCMAKNGGGITVPNNASAPFNMSGGFIVNNKASVAGGGISVIGKNSRIYFSQKVTVSGNTATKSGQEVTCNVELDQDSNDIIHTNNGGLYSGSYIGVYVPDGANLFDKHGDEKKPFGRFESGDNTTNLYCFINDRKGYKGGIIENPDPNTIYWIKIFSLQVSKNVESGQSTTIDPDEPFLFKVNIRGTPSATGQLRPKDIDSSTGTYGDMEFRSNGIDTTTAVFALKNGEHATGINLSEGLDYEIIEYLIVSGGDNTYKDQHIRYAAMPMNGYNSTTETLQYDGKTYTVIKANIYSSKIGENKGRTDVDPYTSVVNYENVMPVCKITDNNGNILYRRYTWKKTTNKEGEQEYYYAPAVYTELTGADGAFKALEGTLYSSNGTDPPSYAVSNGVQIQMLIGDYKQNESISLPQTVNGKVTLKTASTTDSMFPKQDQGTTSTIRRMFNQNSMFNLGGELVLENIILDGEKERCTATVNGGIMNVLAGGRLTIGTDAALQNSFTTLSGGALYVASGGIVNMMGGAVDKNESTGEGAGIYLEAGSTMKLSGNPQFGGTGLNIAGNIIPDDEKPKKGNWQRITLTGKSNGGKAYSRPRQDIFIAGYEGEQGATNAQSLTVDGDITSGDGTIWVWAKELPHYKTLQQFAKFVPAGSSGGSTSGETAAGVTNVAATLAAFRNARPDADTGADYVGRYLYGVTKTGDTENNVFWYGIEGSAHVMLVKVRKSNYMVLPGKTFTVYTNDQLSNVAMGKILNNSGVEEEIELSDLQSGVGGAFFIGQMPYGTYYVAESGESGYFEITIDKDGVVEIIDPNTNPKTTEPVKEVEKTP